MRNPICLANLFQNNLQSHSCSFLSPEFFIIIKMNKHIKAFLLMIRITSDQYLTVYKYRMMIYFLQLLRPLVSRYNLRCLLIFLRFYFDEFCFYPYLILFCFYDITNTGLIFYSSMMFDLIYRYVFCINFILTTVITRPIRH